MARNLDERFSRKAQTNQRSNFIPVTPRNRSVNVTSPHVVNNAFDLRLDLETHNWNRDFRHAPLVLDPQPVIVTGNWDANLNWDAYKKLHDQYFNFAVAKAPKRLYNSKAAKLYGFKILNAGMADRAEDDVLTFPTTNIVKELKGVVKGIRTSYMYKRFPRLAKRVKRWIQLRADGPTIPYDDLKKITEPMVICYRDKDGLGEYDKTRVLYPTGQCFVSYYRYLTDVTDFEKIKDTAQFSWSCFSERSTSLENTVEGMKMNDRHTLLIKKMYPYKGSKHRYWRDVHVD